jgi:hypothetical protein
MVRAAIRVGVSSAILAVTFATTAFLSAQNWNADHGVKSTDSSGVAMAGQPSTDDSDEVSPLFVTGDFNRDGILDIAKISPRTQDASESDHLTEPCIPRRCLELPGQWLVATSTTMASLI